tara:strand:- start:31 stop:384 length:354 start_codon:yes stop_codon:yes gene_type:complete
MDGTVILFSNNINQRMVGNIKMKTFSGKLIEKDLFLVEIWGKRNCPYCNRAKQTSKKFGLNYIYHQLDEDFTKEEFLEKFPDAKTFPQIIVDNKLVGGHSDFLTLLRGPTEGPNAFY